jgi:hypothetical protein
MESMVWESMVKKYWLGPCLNVLLLRRTWSKSSTVCCPVRPRM